MTQDRTVVTFLAELEQQDKTLTEWARERKLPMNAVYRVAAQKSMGRWGQARKVLRAMGITPPPVSSKSQG